MFESLQQDNPNWQKINLVKKTLNTKASWYTGLAIKKHIKSKIFSLKEEGFNNPAIESGRWSAYCHYSAVVSLRNLLEKYEINKETKILVNPLTPPELVNEITQKEGQIVSIDVDKTTLQWNPEDVKGHLQNNKNIDLAIFFAFNGIYEPIVETVKALEELSIPSIVFVDNPNLTHPLLDLFESMSSGSIIWDFGDGFVDNILNEVLDQSLQTKRWFASWHIESRTRSILEYHLSESQESYNIILQSYYSLLLNKVKEDGFKSRLLGWGAGKTFGVERKYQKKENALNAIRDNYLKALNSAVPDVFFELYNQTNVENPDEANHEDILHKSTLLQEKGKDFYQFFASQVQLRPEGTIEIPSLNIKKTYLEYFFYSTEQGYWRQFLAEKNIKCRNPLRLHPSFLNRQDLINANFISQFLVSINLLDALEKNINISSNY